MVQDQPVGSSPGSLSPAQYTNTEELLLPPCSRLEASISAVTRLQDAGSQARLCFIPAREPAPQAQTSPSSAVFCRSKQAKGSSCRRYAADPKAGTARVVGASRHSIPYSMSLSEKNALYCLCYHAHKSCHSRCLYGIAVLVSMPGLASAL